MNRKIMRKKYLAVFMCMCVVALISLSYLFIVTHAEHNCTGKDCPICAQIQVAQHFIEQIKTAIITVAVFISAIILSYYNKKVVCIFEESNTLIKQKVRLNN
ncbi:MAG: hypothetical protein ACERKZ_11390 [Lachnotalea sp.]